MTHTKQFIEDAIEGGWKEYSNTKPNTISYYCNTMITSMILIDPKAWQAVSRTREWNIGEDVDCPACNADMQLDWRYYMHFFIERIAMDRTIEEALKDISN